MAKYSRGHAKNVYLYSRRFYRCLFDLEDARRLLVQPPNVQKRALEALAVLSRFLGVYGWFMEWRVQLGLKWFKPRGLDVLRRVLRSELDGLWGWLEECRAALDWSSYFQVAYTALTGLRASEAQNSIALYSRLRDEGRVDDYYNRRLRALEHFKHPSVFIRRNKYAFISFITARVKQELDSFQGEPSYWSLAMKLKRRGLPKRLRHLRKLFAVTLVEAGIPGEAVDLLQGRVGATVFKQFYYRPVLTALRDKVLTALHPLEVRLLG